jgi:crotonobetainyl-CoA:carnitine CoA-transferase CaiB-like acyl-CoA transferase
MILASVDAIVAAVWRETTATAFDRSRLRLTEIVHVLPSIYRVGACATASVALVGLAADALARSLGEPGHVTSVDQREAALSFRSEAYLRIDGKAPNLWAPLSGAYRTADGWVRLHANYARHAQAIAAALDVPLERAAIEATVARRGAVHVELAVLEAGGAAAALRSRFAWHALEAGRAVVAAPLVEITKIGDAPAPVPQASPRVLDLTRVISGPLCGKLLAALGADVLRIGTPALAERESLFIESGFGKRFALLDLREESAREAFSALVRGADVFVQSHRPGALAALGFGAEAAAALRPGIVYVSISAYGRTGPWATRRGFDSLVQVATGLADEARIAYGRAAPVPLPAQALDHATGWLAAFGTLVALERRAREGGSWRVDLSLARTAEWLASLGPCDERNATLPSVDDDPALVETMQSPYGRLSRLRSPLVLDGVRIDAETPPPIAGVALWR